MSHRRRIYRNNSKGVEGKVNKLYSIDFDFNLYEYTTETGKFNLICNIPKPSISDTTIKVDGSSGVAYSVYNESFYITIKFYNKSSDTYFTRVYRIPKTALSTGDFTYYSHDSISSSEISGSWEISLEYAVNTTFNGWLLGASDRDDSYISSFLSSDPYNINGEEFLRFGMNQSIYEEAAYHSVFLCNGNNELSIASDSSHPMRYDMTQLRLDLSRPGISGSSYIINLNDTIYGSSSPFQICYSFQKLGNKYMILISNNDTYYLFYQDASESYPHNLKNEFTGKLYGYDGSYLNIPVVPVYLNNKYYLVSVNGNVYEIDFKNNTKTLVKENESIKMGYSTSVSTTSLNMGDYIIIASQDYVFRMDKDLTITKIDNPGYSLLGWEMEISDELNIDITS